LADNRMSSDASWCAIPWGQTRATIIMSEHFTGSMWTQEWSGQTPVRLQGEEMLQ